MASNTGNEFVRRMVGLILDEQKIVGNTEFMHKNHKNLVNFKYPEELEIVMDLTIADEEDSDKDNKLYYICQQIIEYSVKTSHPNFYNQLYAGVEQYSLSGAWLSEALNTSLATYETSPVFTLMEKYLIKYLGQLAGYKQNDIDGTFCPGGSLANSYGMVMARHHAFPHSKQKGIRSLGQIVIFVSEDSHYSYEKSAVWLGTGTESVIKVKTDGRGRMIPEELRNSTLKAREDNKVPYLVGATAGTTVLGAFDPLSQLADICQEFGLWFHVDAALGGSWLLSKRHRHLLAGIERADSITWDLHKLTCIPQQCTVVLTKHPTLLTECNSLGAEYLFRSDNYYDSGYDLGDKSIQCGRKPDCLKLWLALKAYGRSGMERAINNVYDMAQYLTERLRERPGFQLVMDEFESNLISFWFIPTQLRQKGQTLAPEVLAKIAPEIKKRMMKTGSLMIGYQPLSTKQWPNFFRVALMCFPEPNKEDMDYIIDEIERLGNDIEI